ncbi:putative membrane protein [Arcobacter venerupis]|uniref:Membrane protein n=1 Tax=Arcobacter venerupis TaxID=1054033 RepID=A0AAE7BAR3_9BACT|nr:hypothetical protein [Arcobacter venerupis]QKF67050.1 putative membrane protein [Arcobacter venerupis]RWS50004.1 hypothetical protein CKA56_05865 [Arcobacter venerupis]
MDLNFFIFNTFCLMKSFIFTPLLLIGLLITSLSLILTLKNNNIYIKEFKNHKNAELFIKTIFDLSRYLVISFFYSLTMSFFHIDELLSNFELVIYFIFSVIYILLLLVIGFNLFKIVSNIKDIVLVSLKD